MPENVVVNPRVHIMAAEIVGKDRVMDQTANMVLKLARVNAIKHRLTGNYLSKLSVIDAGNGKDRLVVADDEAAVPIEFGHVRIKRGPGRRVRATFVQGTRIMRDAFAAVPRVH
jgi:hypothetical protein